MAFTIVESILLWGPPLVTIAFAFGYYFWWGKEEDERSVGSPTSKQQVSGSEE